MTRIGIVNFPGSTDARDVARAVSIAGCEPVELLPTDDSFDVEALILPGGFSYGDYVRPGAIASTTAIAQPITDAAHHDIPILGIGNGFQILCELGLLPGSLVQNSSGRMFADPVPLVIETADTTWTNAFQSGQKISLVFKSGFGNYQAPDSVIEQLEASNGVVARFVTNPTGSRNNIAAVTNVRGNVVGLMAHPEHSIEALTGAGRDGLGFFHSIQRFLTMTKGSHDE